jgi:Fe-S oxidoreductase
MYLAKALIRNQTEYSQRLAELVYTCSTCRGCDELCMLIQSVNPEMPLSDIIRLIRYELVKRGFLPEKIKSHFNTVKARGDLPNHGQGAVPAIPTEIAKASADLVLYSDCFHSAAQDDMYVDAVQILQKIGEPISLYTTGGCCGSTLFDYGFWDELPALVDAKTEQMKPLAGSTFLFVNPHCQEFITNRYDMIASDPQPIKGLHISEFIAAALSDGRLTAKDGRDVTVSYHDPCMLARGLGITEPPRQALKALNNVTLVEMKRNRQDTFCCGSRAMGEYFAEFPEATARQRIDEFKATGADLLITACPYCKDIFQKVLGTDKDRVKDLMGFVLEKTA